MKKYQGIKQNSHFKKLYQKGKSFAAPCFFCYIKKNSTGQVRMGLTVSKKIGKAVLRNRAKRVLRVAAQSAVNAGLCGVDMILVARSRTPFVKSTRVENELLDLLLKQGYIKGPML